jgi:hypothetical protein
MSQELLKKFRDAGQGSRSQKEIVRRAENQLRRNEMLGQKPNKALQTIMGEFVKESGDQLSAKRRNAIAGASWMVGGPALKVFVKGVQAGRAALAGLPKGITKVRDGFKVGDKTYKTLGGAKGAVTKAGKKPPPPPKTPPANVKSNIDKAAPSVRAAGRPNKIQKGLQKGEKEAAKLKKAAGSGRKPPGKLKAAVVPVATGLAAIAATTGSKPKPKLKPKSTVADVKRKPALPKVEAKPKKPAPKKPVRSGTGRGNMAGKNMGSESVSEYFGDMQGRKTKVRLPFGMGTVDVDSTKSAYDNDESVEMGQKKGGRMTTVRRRMGGKVRGYGKAMRGY